MPNVVVQLSREIDRVRALLPKLDASKRALAEYHIRVAGDAWAYNSVEAMMLLVAELQEFEEPKR